MKVVIFFECHTQVTCHTAIRAALLSYPVPGGYKYGDLTLRVVLLAGYY
jgi:hypothetical protein